VTFYTIIFVFINTK